MVESEKQHITALQKDKLKQQMYYTPLLVSIKFEVVPKKYLTNQF